MRKSGNLPPATPAGFPHRGDPAWLVAWMNDGAAREQALARFDTLAPVEVPQMLGRWRGAGLRSGHRLDGVLEALGWYGKEFRSSDDVDPLLFRRPDGRVRAVDPAFMPVRLGLALPFLARGRLARAGFGLGQFVLGARGPSARLRKLDHRGVASAAMVYDRQPIIDHFRRIDDDTVLGLMDMRATSAPFFFLLRRESPEIEMAGATAAPGAS